MTIPPGTITEPGQAISAEHRELHQLTGKTIRKAVFNVVTVDGKALAELMIACSDGSAIQVTATGSVNVEMLG